MDILLVVIFMALGIMFLMLEIFFLPGISIGGAVGAIFTGVAIWYSFSHIGENAGWVTVVCGVLVFFVAIYLFIKGRTLDKIALKKELGDVERPFQEGDVRIGNRGFTLTRLAPVGKISINGFELEARSQNNIIGTGEDVEVVDIDGVTITVEIVKR